MTAMVMIIKLWNPAILDCRKWRKFGEHGEHGEDEEHGKHGKNDPGSAQDWRTSSDVER